MDANESNTSGDQGNYESLEEMAEALNAWLKAEDLDLELPA